MTSQTQNQNSAPTSVEEIRPHPVDECVDQVRPHPADEYVGKGFKKQRLIRGLSQHQLASKLGITFQEVEKYEKGTNRVHECVGKVRPHPVDECVGKEIKKQRLIRGLSQHQLAGKLGITFQQVQKYEKGTNRIVISRLYELTQVLGIEVQDLMSKLQDDLRTIGEGIASSESALREGDEAIIEEDNSEHQVDSKEILMLVRAFVCIKNEKVRNTIYTLAKSLSADQQDTDFENSYKDSDLKSRSGVSKRKKSDS